MTFQKIYFSIVWAMIMCAATSAHFIYLNTGAFKFIAGIGLPVNLKMSGSSFSWFTNVQVFYKLPDNITFFEPYQIMHKRSLKNTFNRVSLYEAILKNSERLGLSGSECIHRLICEIAHRKVNRSVNGLFGEIVQILFSPAYDSGRGLTKHKAAQWQGLYNSSACGVVYEDCFFEENSVLLGFVEGIKGWL